MVSLLSSLIFLSLLSLLLWVLFVCFYSPFGSLFFTSVFSLWIFFIFWCLERMRCLLSCLSGGEAFFCPLWMDACCTWVIPFVFSVLSCFLGDGVLGALAFLYRCRFYIVLFYTVGFVASARICFSFVGYCVSHFRDPSLVYLEVHPVFPSSFPHSLVNVLGFGIAFAVYTSALSPSSASPASSAFSLFSAREREESSSSSRP